MENIIEITELSKSFGSVKAVDMLSFQVHRGELFAFLGVNGAGKSTTISIISGQLRPDSGSVKICGEELNQYSTACAEKIGVVFQSSVLDKALSARDNLRSRAALYGITGSEFTARLSELSEMLKLESLLKRPLGKLSGGERRRIDIARALLHRPEILILDEPTTGLDPQTRRLLWDTVEKLRKSSKLTVFLTTHYMEEAADADYVLILDSGKIAAAGTPIELKNKYTGDFITVYGEAAEKAAALGFTAERQGNYVKLSVPDTATATQLIIAHPELFKDYEITKGKMDDVFLAVTGKSLTGGN